MMFKACKECTAPKRHPGCHDRCPEYLKEKAEYQEWKAKHDLERRTESNIYTQRTYAVRKAMRHRRWNK
jgi:hypothetical protein